jgi:hypothetical protein
MAWVLSATVASGPSDAALLLTGYRPYIPSGVTTMDGIAFTNASVFVAGTTRVLCNRPAKGGWRAS